ncbi:integrin alpha beta-propellor repeat-containing protein [Nitzschia inconspicua]|uniref:Integrin alpha beta-propellor repeat-containing protein n=1 Tax=Nitzschia inconspicua TaxID=303405 RepID=A0A9K3L567_9STRA|nr:integrin alpha beta-propellor repeat-containing protein [Nitzschia inconspicua]
MFSFSNSTGGNTEHTTSSSDRSLEEDHRSIDDGCAEDDYSGPSSSFQLPRYLASPPTTPGRSSLARVSSVSSTSSGSSNSSNQRDLEEQRLVLLAKYPNVNEDQVQQTMERQRRKEDLVTAVAMKKGQKFREQQQLCEAQQRQRLQPAPAKRLSRNMNSLIEESSSEDGDRGIETGHQVACHTPIPFSNSCTSRQNQHSKTPGKEMASFVVWQAATQGTGDKLYNGTPTPQRITFQEELPPPQIDEQPIGSEKERRGIVGLAAYAFGKILHAKSSNQPPSSGASIVSDSLDGRSINTANKSLASKASLPSLSSEQTRKINNLSSKDRMNKNMDSINESHPEDGRSGFYHLISSRNGVIILILCLVLIIAIIVTVAAAFQGAKRAQQQSNTNTNYRDFSGPPPTQSPEMGQLGIAIPTISPYDDALLLTDPPSSTTAASTSSYPTKTLFPTTSEPTSSEFYSLPTLPPSVSPSASPPKNFSDWIWTQRGLSLRGNEIGERFGQSVAISEDGKIVAIGSPYSTVDGLVLAGTVHIFQWDDSDRRGWISRGLLKGRNRGDQFGSNIALSSNGTVIAVSEPTYRGQSGDRSGNVRVFVHNPFNGYSPLGQELEGVGATDHFGIGLSVSADGRRIAAGAPYHDNTGTHGNGNINNRLVSGHALVFEWSSEIGQWTPIGEPMTGRSHLDWFGWSIDLNRDGSVTCIGAPRNLEYGGYVQCYEEGNSGGWMMIGSPIENGAFPGRHDDSFGASLKLSWDSIASRHRVAVGSPGKNRDALDAGVAVVYEYDPQLPSIGWTQLGEVIASPSPGQSNRFAASLDLQGDLLAIGIPGAGEVNLFRFQRDSGLWELHPQTLRGVSGSSFGTSVRLTPSGDVAVGSPQYSETDDIGTVNVFNSL